MKIILREEGFTLIELSIVLFIFSLVSLFSITSIQRTQRNLELNLFLEEISSSLTLVQTHAILNEETTFVEILPTSREFRFRVRGNHNHEISHTVFLPETVSLYGGARDFDFKRGSGNVTKFSTIRLKTHKGDYGIVFQIGSGRFDIKKMDE